MPNATSLVNAAAAISLAEQLAIDFVVVARIAGVNLPEGAVTVEVLPAPHASPLRLPAGKVAVYVFAKGAETLKVGKVGAKSHARYTSQHYIPGSAKSTLAASILLDAADHRLTEEDIGSVGIWIRTHVDRINFLLDERFGPHTLALFEAFLQCRLNPRYEGFKSQTPIG